MRKIYMAPMEGITGYVFRNAHSKVYGKLDRYFTPFIVPVEKREFKKRELRDIDPENNKGLPIVPQILTNSSAGFLKTCKSLKNYGYTHVNLNLGCPSGTVTAKNKGAGFLREPGLLDRFLWEIFNGTDMKISVKTRIGYENYDEFPRLMEIFNRYPIEELIIHPRLRMDFYKNHVNMDSYEYAEKNSVNRLCYNGDIKFIGDIDRLQKKFTGTEAFMIGRGLVARPYMFDSCQSDSKDKKYGSKNKADRLREFHDFLLHGFIEEMDNDTNVLYKMKEIWFYMGQAIMEDEGDIINDKIFKKIKKAGNLREYCQYTDCLFRELM